jgi:hypothetical protein
MHRKHLLTLLVLLAGGCSPRAALDAAATSPQAQFAEETAALLFKKNLDALLLQMAPELRKDATPEMMGKLFAAVPSGEPMESTVVGYHQSGSPGVTDTTVSLQYEFPKRFVLVQVTVRSSGAQRAVTYLRLERLPDSLDRVNAFHLGGQSHGHYVVLGLAILVPVFIVITLVVCVRTPLPNRKWLWLLFVAVGMGRMSLNWTTGALSVTPLSVDLFGAGVTARGPYSPWIVSVAMPVGALLFLWRRRSLMSQHRPAKGGGVEQADEAVRTRAS